MSDFEIDESYFDRSQEEIIDEQMTEAIRELRLKREKLLALALYRGYDGVDIYAKDGLATGINQYDLGFEYEAWQNKQPDVDRFKQSVRRYDFRALTREEKRILLSRIGVLLEDWEDD